ncbi:serine/threonine protein kinase [Jiangella aurantiaca]|uniref:Serine/threonine protein kinase n=1 Tax=Jiangella aurantiaca TaxID=2530373 RepID=A0A4R5AB17_9ACTN|nr:serine/threonine-protein kinase [Jiangella aurantiaca]TDD69518.1 serine/threonine protein kinase [Jiangella aurantiaca]
MDARPAELTHIGPYRVVRQLGEGGMGVVYLATARDGRPVAVKTLRPWLVGGTDGRRRFEREVATLVRVRGDRVAEVLDADVSADPPYIVTRFVDGVPLSAWVAEHGPLAAPDLRILARGLLEALTSVHAAGVVHRDIKPGNVMLAAGGPVLIDFGIAHATDDTRLTATGLISGTPGYFAPETVLGRDPTPATDVHAWAATLTYAATGRPPYGGGPDLAVVDRIRRGEHDLSGVEPWLATVLDVALHPDPARRPGVPALAQALGPDEPPTIAAAPPTLAAPPALDDTAVIAPVPPLQLQPAPPPYVPPTQVQPPTLPGYDRRIREQRAREQQPPKPSPLAVPPPRPGGEPPAPRSWRSRLAIGLGGLLLVFLIAGMPYAGAVAALLILLTGRIVWRIQRRLFERRETRGAHRNDSVVAALAAPWDAVAAALPCLAQLLVAALGALLVGGLLDLLDAGGARTPSIGAAVVATWLVWRGPGTVRSRHGIRAILAPLDRSREVAWVVLGALFVLACGAVLIFDSFGAGWWPADLSLTDLDRWPG